jgi:lysozyme family protein
MATSNRRASFLATMKWEGGETLSLNRRDPGNWTGNAIGVGKLVGTRFGVSAGAHPTLDIANLTVEEALAIYVNQYWHPLDADALAVGVDYCVADDAYNSGPSSALRRWSKISKTASTAATIHAYSKLRLSFLEGLRGWKAFGRGWTARVAGVEAESLKMAANEPNPGAVLTDKTGAPSSVEAARGAKPLLGAPVGAPWSDHDYGALEASEASARARSMAALISAVTLGAYGLNRFGIHEDLRASAALVAALGAVGGVGVVWNLWNWRAHRARSAALAALACEPPNRA